MVCCKFKASRESRYISRSSNMPYNLVNDEFKTPLRLEDGEVHVFVL